MITIWKYNLFLRILFSKVSSINTNGYNKQHDAMVSNKARNKRWHTKMNGFILLVDIRINNLKIKPQQ